MGFPVFHGGIAPLDSKGRGRVMALDVPVRCAGVKVAPGDLIFGDADGVVVIPRADRGEGADARLRQDQGREAHARRSARRREAGRRVREVRHSVGQARDGAGRAMSSIIGKVLQDQRDLLLFRPFKPALKDHWAAYLAWGLFVTWLAGIGPLLGPSERQLVAIRGARFGRLCVRALRFPLAHRCAAAPAQLELHRRADFRHADLAAGAALRDPGREVHVAGEPRRPRTSSSSRSSHRGGLRC